jgi:hypothetical protein
MVDLSKKINDAVNHIPNKSYDILFFKMKEEVLVNTWNILRVQTRDQLRIKMRLRITFEVFKNIKV